MLALILKGLGTRESSAVGCGGGRSGSRGVLKLCPSNKIEAFSTEVIARKKIIGQLIYKKLNLLL